MQLKTFDSLMADIKRRAPISPERKKEGELYLDQVKDKYDGRVAKEVSLVELRRDAKTLHGLAHRAKVFDADAVIAFVVIMGFSSSHPNNKRKPR